MDDAPALGDPDRSGAKSAGIANQTPKHETVCGKQVPRGRRAPVWQGIIRGEGVLHLLDLAGFAQHPLSRNHRGDLLQAEGIILDRQRGVDTADAVLMSEPGHAARTREGPDSSQLTCDLCHQGQGRGSDAVGRRVAAWKHG